MLPEVNVMSIAMNFQLSLPPAQNPKEQALRRSTLAATMHTLQHVFEQATTEDLVAVNRILTQAATQAPVSEVSASEVSASKPLENTDLGGADDPARSDRTAPDILMRLYQGHTYSALERVALEAENQARLFDLRRSILEDTLTAVGVARLLGTTRQTPYDRAKKGTLLALIDRGTLRFPRWQFDPQGPGGVVAGLPAVIGSLRVSPLAKALWLTGENSTLEGRSPLMALQAGEQERVLDAALAVGVA